MLEVVGFLIIIAMFITVVIYLVKYLVRFARHITTPSCTKCKHYDNRHYNACSPEKCFICIPENLRKFNGAWWMAFETKDIRGTKYCKFEPKSYEQ